MKGLTIVRLGAENIKRLKAVEIVPSGNTVTISGRNDQGKTSILDAIEYALGGRNGICDEPIRKGQQKARIVCDLGEIIVERRFSSVSGDSTLTVRGRDGAPVKSPQTLLDELCSHVAFDPLSFVRMKSDQQVETLRKLVGLDFTDLNRRRQKAYDDRTIAGRELSAAKAKLAEWPFDESAPVKEISVSELTEKLSEARAKNSRHGGCLERIRRLELDRNALQARREVLAKQLAEIDVQVFETDERLQKETAELMTLPQADETAIARQIAVSEAVNLKIRTNIRHQEITLEVQKQQDLVDKLTHDIESIDQEKSDRLAWTEFPLDGLSFDDSRVLLNGVPFSQGSQARQLQAAVAIGLALNPKVRVILIRDGSLLDDDSMRLIAGLAEKHQAQIWIEVVNSGDPSAVVIEDGEVKHKSEELCLHSSVAMSQ